MLNHDYARLGLALMAALGVHSLLFLGILDEPVAPQPEILMQVQMIPQTSIQAAELSLVTPHHTAIQNIKHDSNETVNEHEVTPAQQVAQATQQPEQAVEALSQTSHEPLLVPEHVQSLVLTKIYYPRRAKYRGWQGEAELRFGIDGSAIRDVQLFSSTGFTVLDQAAFQALVSMASLPLSDGFYRLPVVFKLQ